ncbi:MAG: MerR family transcriptional regulator [Lachnospiraceae bacterium]|nr:MerR family transcriptional regulator [Lachnospiraceae bacterium]
MTIKEFSELCGCNPQTLRYYDHMNLLKPVKVDEWTGYRYYDEEQALSFVKIKNLQTAGFTIDEIKGLLDEDDATIYEAFSQKIKEHEEKLNQIKEIQLSYQSEMTNMQTKIEDIRRLVTKSLKDYDATEEFGITGEEYQKIMDSVNEAFEGIMNEELDFDIDFTEYAKGGTPKEEERYQDILSNPDYEQVYEKHDWNYVKEFLDDFSELEDGAEYFLQFSCLPEKADSTAFANTVLGILNLKNMGKVHSFACNTTHSEDGKNHFWLLKKTK